MKSITIHSLAYLFLHQVKTQSEQQLTSKKEKVLLEIDKVRKRIAELGEANDMKAIGHYVKEVKAIERKLHDLHAQVFSSIPNIYP